MKSIIVTFALAATFVAPAIADVGSCVKPAAPQVPANVETLSVEEYTGIYQSGETYFENAKGYLKCLDQIIYQHAPEEEIVGLAGKEHPNYINEWGPIWGSFNMACINWEMKNGTPFPGGCVPSNPGM